MKFLHFLALSATISTPALAQQSRQLDAHEHGVGQLNIAFDGGQVAMELHAPGADIVGFEYAAESAEDRAAVDAAVATLARPLDLFLLPEAAGCSVVQASAELESEDAHEDHDEEHGHDDHDEDHIEEHAADDHEKEHADDDHDDDHGEGHGHDDHDDDHDAHANEAGHTEFHAEYLLTCADPTAVSEITFAYFEIFPNALEVEVQVLSADGAKSFEVERNAPELDLRGMF